MFLTAFFYILFLSFERSELNV